MKRAGWCSEKRKLHQRPAQNLGTALTTFAVRGRWTLECYDHCYAPSCVRRKGPVPMRKLAPLATQRRSERRDCQRKGGGGSSQRLKKFEPIHPQRQGEEPQPTPGV